MNPDSFSEIKDSYRAARITKAAFVQAMHARHAALFEYRRHLADCNLQEIRITHAEVVATFRDPAIAMVCPPEDSRMAPIEAFNFGDYERDEIQLLRSIVAHLGGASVRFFDIGANAGFYSLALSRYFPGITGAAFEPIPATFALLKRNFALNQVAGVAPFNAGLSEKPGELVFYTYPSQSGSSSMTRNVDAPDVQEVRCSVWTLDAFATDHPGRIDLIKCDVEGAELFVFKGGRQTLARDQPVIFTEMLRKWCAKYSYHPNDIIALLRELGYGCYVTHDGKLRACAEVTTETTETNFFFLHGGKHAALIQQFSGHA
jgi:FkbM family methyltransferase